MLTSKGEQSIIQLKQQQQQKKKKKIVTLRYFLQKT